MFRCSVALLALLGSASLPAQVSTSSRLASGEVPGHLVVVYRDGQIPANAEATVAASGGRVALRLERFGMDSVKVPVGHEEVVATRLRSRPEVAAVLHDRYVSGHLMLLRALPQVPTLEIVPTAAKPTAAIVEEGSGTGLGRVAAPSIFGHAGDAGATPAPASDPMYNSPQGWAVRQAGGYGDNITGGAAVGPWNASLGAGVRIAVLDSGVDATHPDLAPNLIYSVSDVDQSAATGEPSACDDGSPQDQEGHGTWVASLALGALGPGTGEVIGVAPQASLLNIKVLERLPAETGPTVAANCEAGQAGGMLSWVLKGIDDAVTQKADIVVLSLGSIVDLTTGDGAGWKAQFDSVTYTATQAGTILVAAVGNDGLNLSGGQFLELPAQARGVLPVVASTNPACAENLSAGATCSAGPVSRPYYSNYGATLNAVAAPGGSYPEGPDTGASGYVRGACSNGLPGTSDGLPPSSTQAAGQSLGCFGLGHVAYVQAMGTSASASLVAGAAAILKAARPDWSAAQVVAALRSSATVSGSETEPQLNLAAALALP